MSPPETLDEALHRLAEHLGPLRERVVFVGGAIRGLLMTDPAAPEARPTDDIDVIVEVASRGEYHDEIERRLHERDFINDARPGAPTCRFLRDGLTVDVMPTLEGVLGSTNRWYVHAMKTANVVTLPGPPPLDIRVVSAASFVATKLTAFASRGGDDLRHHDVEDVVAVVDGRPGLLRELVVEPVELRQYVAQGVRRLFELGLAEDVRGHLPGDAAGTAREPILRTRLRRLERLSALATKGAVTRIAVEIEAKIPGHRPRGRFVSVVLHVDCDIDGIELEADDGVCSPVEPRATAAMQRDQAAGICCVFDIARDAEDLHLLLPGLGCELVLEPS